jgi:tyrosyl-tRNA synthetase
VNARLGSQKGISFTEFSYQLLQAYDFYELHKNAGCHIQVGGSDQWGNILAGIELIDSLEATNPGGDSFQHGFGITTPLLTNSKGEKFGKSEGNAIWLDERMTSVYDFYQVRISQL